MLLEVHDVDKTFTNRFGSVTAAFGVSFEVSAGECFGLIGESGSGKSTIASIVSGTLAPDSGTVCLDGQALDTRSARSRKAHQRKLQMVFQDPRASFNPRMKVMDALREPLIHKLGRAKDEADAAIEQVMEQVNLPTGMLRRGVHTISVGQAQRVAIARALLAEPRLIVCDEITSALDVTVQASILELLAHLRREQELSMLFVSHDMAVVAQLSDRVAVMESGRIIEQGPVDQVIGNPVQEYTRLLIDLA
ncbi:ABC transporter ATP-binding protein [Propionibacterium sp. oral taxon 192]|uniref:ABC transporter ATP-binding protein n=1 Tax=Propionibacterium sp. oral taxon 192 TaxID=671222 RepID=UPI0018DEBF70|nr:dipeptide/oligopeptide/nickel ABC transporter ATP-binding protein [Propionibacterium sp. oral taxon 192]